MRCRARRAEVAWLVQFPMRLQSSTPVVGTSEGALPLWSSTLRRVGLEDSCGGGAGVLNFGFSHGSKVEHAHGRAWIVRTVRFLSF